MKSKRVLYALQGTGNGHVSRAREIIPILQNICDLDVFIGGTESELDLPVEPKYKAKGFVMFYNSSGGVSFWRTLVKNNYWKLIFSIIHAPVGEYDLIINDFEFVTAWACKFRKQRCIQLSHQAAFAYKQTPRPARKNVFGEFVLRHYAPSSAYIGFHFNRYHQNIYPPVIRKEIHELISEDGKHVTVYLPAFHYSKLAAILNELPKIDFHIFCKKADKIVRVDNVIVKPIEAEAFKQSFSSCAGIICGAGFEAPAEAIHLGKRLLVMPIKNQYEQIANAAALEKEGIQVLQQWDSSVVPRIEEWLHSPKPIPKRYPTFINKLLAEVVLNAPKTTTKTLV